MAIPSKKSPEMDATLDKFVRSVFSNAMGRQESIEANLCAVCKGEALVFTDDISKHEYTISGMCQKCQDGVYGENS